MTADLPILYSFRRCPYAIRARLAIYYSGIQVEIREISLSNKPEPMLALSPKGTVPVLVLPNSKVIEESLDIMHWALSLNDPKHWLDISETSYDLIDKNDGHFKYYLDRYKYADRYPEFTEMYYRRQAESFISELDYRLTLSTYLCGDRFTVVDAAIFPFIRQFSKVDNTWFQASDYHALKHWLEQLIYSDLFQSVMANFPLWKPGLIACTIN